MAKSFIFSFLTNVNIKSLEILIIFVELPANNCYRKTIFLVEELLKGHTSLKKNLCFAKKKSATKLTASAKSVDFYKYMRALVRT